MQSPDRFGILLLCQDRSIVILITMAVALAPRVVKGMVEYLLQFDIFGGKNRMVECFKSIFSRKKSHCRVLQVQNFAERIALSSTSSRHFRARKKIWIAFFFASKIIKISAAIFTDRFCSMFLHDNLKTYSTNKVAPVIYNCKKYYFTFFLLQQMGNSSVAYVYGVIVSLKSVIHRSVIYVPNIIVL
jgi:hypothetical protein